ncbi:endo-beta-N-acetylglucosaminidase, partial [Companilactobacillus heilongjiangensis]|uniref:F5/8 type C domain-containing protein n=1 Tax=Companilactobacillus heilongjiangensis TaxID=1074467 RepID=A0A0K2LB60_9LACO
MSKKGFILAAAVGMASVTLLCSSHLDYQVAQAAIGTETAFKSQGINDLGTNDFEKNPEATALFPEGLLKWSPQTDPDASYNVSNVKLAKRAQGQKVNDYQNPDAKVLSIAITNRHTAGTPSQGDSNKAVYNFTNWQYVDTLVAWAGSSGEGIIVPPSGDLTDAAHRNGVPVVGTVFFPPSVYGGKTEWVKQFVQKDKNGKFIVADKLLEMADYYGFDGWFINEETDVDEQTAHDLRDMMVYLNEHKKSSQQIIWYDAMLPSGDVTWQGALNDENSSFFQQGDKSIADKMFIDFRWTKDKLSSSNKEAFKLGRNPYDLFAGIDLQANGINSSRNPEMLLDESGKLKTSIGLYCPDWTLRDGANYDVDKYWENEQKMWTNANNDPRKVDTSQNWQGISKYVVEKTPVTQFPFVTNFNVGNGDNYYKNGQLMTSGAYNNRSIQDILPTYRWILDNAKGNKLSAKFSYKNVFNGGSSVELSGDMKNNAASYIKLYASDVKATGSESAKIVVKGEKNLELVLTDENDKKVTLDANKYDNINGWHEYGFSLSKLAGKTIKSIGLNVYGSTGENQINIGSMTFSNGQFQRINNVTGLKVQGKTVTDDMTENVRLQWDKANDDTAGYNIYQRKSNGHTTLAGTTSNNAFTITNEKRSEGVIEYIVTPKDIFNNEYSHKSATTSYTFNVLEKPEAIFSSTSTFVKAGEEVTLAAKVSPSTQSVEWEIPGAEVVSQTEKGITVKFAKAGQYSVNCKVTNAAGTTEVRKADYITVYDESAGYSVQDLTKLDGVSATEGSGFTNENEDFSHAIDGDLTTKWCDNSHENPFMIVDLGNTKTITGFELYNAATGGEDSAWNTKDYDILVSNDKQNWTTVVEHRNNTLDISKDAISKTEARYVKLFIHKAEQSGNTARIYGFKIMGVDQTGV